MKYVVIRLVRNGIVVARTAQGNKYDTKIRGYFTQNTSQPVQEFSLSRLTLDEAKPARSAPLKCHIIR